MGLRKKGKTAIRFLLIALLLETGLCNLSFWSTLFAREEDMTSRIQTVYGASLSEEGGDAYEEGGYTRVPEGCLWLKAENLDRQVKRIRLDLDIPEGYLIRATVFAQDEGNSLLYQLGDGRVLLRQVPGNAFLKVYPYGKVKHLYIRLETADSMGNAAAGSMGDLVCNVLKVGFNGRAPFVFRPVRFLLLLGVTAFLLGLKKDSAICRAAFWPEPGDVRGMRKRRVCIFAFLAAMLLLLAFFVRINPQCRKNLAEHHAQYQELARALAEGEVSVGASDPALMTAENPYDTIGLQAAQIPYRADYAWYEGKYYVYFGIVPELLVYLPRYLLTGEDAQNYQAVLLFMGGFWVACAGLVYEIMRRWFGRLPFLLYFVGAFMLACSGSLFYLLIRPDLYHVPIAAACMFVTAGLWAYLAGLRRERGTYLFYEAGSLCLALTAGCRPQFLLFSLLAIPLFGKEIAGRRLFSKESKKETAAFTLPFLAVGAGLMWYNAIRFGSPFDFGASYSLTSNDMTHRGFNLERVLYGLWYFLFQPVRLEGKYPWLLSAQIETDYLGKMVSESCFGGIFAGSMLTWPVFALWGLRKKTAQKQAFFLAGVSAAIALVICGVDATGAGILQRYSCDISYGLFLAALIGLFFLAQRAVQGEWFGAFLGWLKAAVLLHLAYLALLLLQTEGSVNLLRGDPALFYTIQAAMRW